MGAETVEEPWYPKSRWSEFINEHEDKVFVNIQDKALHSFANTKVEEMMILNIFTFLSLIGIVHLR